MSRENQVTKHRMEKRKGKGNVSVDLKRSADILEKSRRVFGGLQRAHTVDGSEIPRPPGMYKTRHK